METSANLVFSSVPIIFGLESLEHIFTDLANSKLKFDFGTTPTMSKNRRKMAHVFTAVLCCAVLRIQASANDLS